MNDLESIEPSQAPNRDVACVSKPLVVSVDEFRHLVGNIGKTLAFALLKAREVDRVKIGGRTGVAFESIERFIERSIANSAERS